MTQNYTGKAENFSEPKVVPGTCRRIMSMKDGVQMERAYIYLPHETWEALRSQSAFVRALATASLSND